MNNNFKLLFCRWGNESRNKIKKIISENLNFSDYFLELVDSRYNNGQVSDILRGENIKNKDEIIESLFESQKGYKLLIITFFAQKKVEEKGFLEELEKNYGVLLDADNLMKEIKQRLNEIKCFSQLYKYIGCDLLKSNDINNEIELISYAYVKAKYKRYINIKSLDNNKQYNSFNFWNSN